MANSYKNLIITPNRSSGSDDPKIVFSGANTTANTDITLRMYPTANGTLSFEGSAGQLFSITNDLTGTIYSVSDVSGIPSLAVYANGQVDIARYSGNTFIGTNGHVMTITGNTWNNSTGTGLVVKGYNTVGSGITLQPSNSSSYSAGWSLYAGASGAGIGDGAFGFWNHTAQTYSFWADQSNNTFSTASSRAPIFYDSDDTSYYVNPNSTSSLTSVLFGGGPTLAKSGNNGSSNLQLQGASGTAIGLVGLNSSGSFCFQLYASTSDYGFLASTWGAWDIRKANGGGMYLNNQSTYYVSTDTTYMSRVYGITDIRSPLFYDNDNTGYYADPASNSRLNTINCGDVYNDLGGWFRNYGATGIYNQSYGNHFYSRSGSTWVVTGNGGAIELQFRSTHESTIRGYVYADTSNSIGFLNSGGSWRLRVVSDDYTLAEGSSMRAPLFYDSNDTGYYVDPNTTGVALRIAGAIQGNHVAWTGEHNKIQWHSDHMYFQNMNNGYWLFRRSNGAEPFSLHADGYGVATGSWRAPIFYDQNDTGYYIDANNTSVMNRIAVVRSSNNVYTDADYGYGLVGAYSSYRYQGVFAMGDSYKLPADGTTTGSLYGMAWSHPNAGGAAGNLNSHGLLILQNGSFMAALSNNGTFSADVRGTIFYDYSNTGYYLDPNAGTSINVAGAILAGGNITAYYSDERLKTKLGPIENAIDKVKTLDGFYYQANEVAQKLGYKVKRELGLSAQQVQAILPEIVAPAPIDNRYLTIHYERVVPLLVEAIKELNHKHETEIAELKQALAALLNKQ